MDPDQGSSKSWRWPWSKSKGSVQRARQMMEIGQRPSAPEPSPQPQEPSNDAEQSAAAAARVTQWPLLDSRDLNILGPNRSPRGAPDRPPRPEGSGPTGLGITLPPAQSFSQSFSRPLPKGRDSSGARSGSGPNISVTNEERSRWSANTDSTAESTGPSSSSGPPKKAMGLLPPQAPPLSKSARHTFNRRSSVSPIPEELSENMSHRNSHALSGMSLTDSPSTGRESDIYSSFIGDESLDWQQARTSHRDNGEGLVRQASLGKRGKPSLRVIQKPSKTSLAASEGRPSTSEENTIGRSMPKAVVGDAPPLPNDGLKVPSPKDSYSSLSDRSYEFDLEKGAFVLDVGQGSSQQAQEDLPRAAPTMSDKRPNAPKPPKLDLGAVRDAEARGSLTSLPDLIRRATRLASNLDNGRTASRTGHRQSPRAREIQRNSRASNLDDTLASFPPPPRDRSSWPAFFRRSTLHNVETLNSATDSERERQQNDCSRRCCGMPLWLFITVCVALVIIITLAILLPLFLVVVPKQNSSQCEQTTPCENGGVSVSSGPVCSCICTNGYTGARCNIPGDVGCTTTAIDGRSAAKSATMGKSLPPLFQQSKQYRIPLDPVTAMALFNQDGVSCTDQNELVSVSGDSTGSKRSEHAKRAATSNGIVYEPRAATDTAAPAAAPTAADDPSNDPEPPNTATASKPEPTTADAETCTDAEPAPAPTAGSDATHPHPTHTTTSPTSSTTSAATPTSTSTSTGKDTNLFARIAVLYVFQSTGKMAAGTQARENLAAYLSGGGSGVYTLDLSKAGVNQRVTVDFEKYRVEI